MKTPKRSSVVNVASARTSAYRRVLETIESEDKCPFCATRLKYHRKPILKRSGRWFLTENSWSYKEAKHRLLIIPKEHKEKLSDLTPEDMISVLRLANWAVKELNIRGGALVSRFGDPVLTGASVRHLHFHLISPRRSKSGRARVVYFPIG